MSSVVRCLAASWNSSPRPCATRRSPAQLRRRPVPLPPRRPWSPAGDTSLGSSTFASSPAQGWSEPPAPTHAGPIPGPRDAAPRARMALACSSLRALTSPTTFPRPPRSPSCKAATCSLQRLDPFLLLGGSRAAPQQQMPPQCVAHTLGQLTRPGRSVQCSVVDAQRLRRLHLPHAVHHVPQQQKQTHLPQVLEAPARLRVQLISVHRSILSRLHFCNLHRGRCPTDTASADCTSATSHGGCPMTVEGTPETKCLLAASRRGRSTPVPACPRPECHPSTGLEFLYTGMTPRPGRHLSGPARGGLCASPGSSAVPPCSPFPSRFRLPRLDGRRYDPSKRRRSSGSTIDRPTALQNLPRT